MKFTMPNCCVFIAVIIVVVIGTLPVNVDAKLPAKVNRGTEEGKLPAQQEPTEGKNRGTEVGKLPAKSDAKQPTEGKEGDTKAASKKEWDPCSSPLYGCHKKDLYKCDFKTLLEGCPSKKKIEIAGKQLSGTLPAALQNLTDLQHLYVKTDLYFLDWDNCVSASTPLHMPRLIPRTIQTQTS